jgi:subtilase family serine protease
VPSTTPAGLYAVLACADDLKVVAERDETNNCRASASPVSLQAPDLTVTALGDPPAALPRGDRMTVPVTVANEGAAPSPGARVRYYFSVDGTKSAGDTLLSATWPVGILAPGATASLTMTLTAPTAIPLGTYHLIACADDLGVVVELVETNNCRSSTGRVVIGP